MRNALLAATQALLMLAGVALGLLIAWIVFRLFRPPAGPVAAQVIALIVLTAAASALVWWLLQPALGHTAAF